MQRMQRPRVASDGSHDCSVSSLAESNRNGGEQRLVHSSQGVPLKREAPNIVSVAFRVATESARTDQRNCDRRKQKHPLQLDRPVSAPPYPEHPAALYVAAGEVHVEIKQ